MIIPILKRSRRTNFFDLKHCVLSNLGNAKYVVFYINNIKYFWLVDTGASLSIVKSEALPRNVSVRKDETLINGIGGQKRSRGLVDLSLEYKSELFHHSFIIFESLPLKADGILGLDFLNKYQANVNLCTNVLQLYCHGKEYYFNLVDECVRSNNLIIPARSESIHFIEVGKIVNDDIIVCGCELAKDLYLANTIATVKNNRIPIKILNVSEKEITLPSFIPSIQSLNDYNICQFSNNISNASRIQKLLSELKLDYLNKEEKTSIENICAKYSDVFYIDGDKLTTTNIYEQSIIIKQNSTPVYVKPYRLPQALKPEIAKQINKMIEDDIIEESNSEWSSPILLVPKKSKEGSDKKWRLVVDYRKLNETVCDDKFPLPNINEILDSLSGAVYFTHLDLHQGYYQVVLEPNSRKLTAFTTNTGQYQMKRLPMGLKISPSAFSRMMSVAMSGLTYEKCLVYQDDLIVFGRNLEIHNQNLINIMERLRKVNLKLNPQKCEFLKKEILYLGHVVSEKGVLPDPEKTYVLKNYPIPKTADEVKRFVAFCNYYRKFIKHFSDIALPLNKLCRKGEHFIWTDDCKHAFEYLKTALISSPILQYPDFTENNEFILQTDASDTSVGAVLCNKDHRPVAYASRPLNKAEKNYPTIQKELLAIVWSVKYFRPYLYGREFTILTDHKPLIYLFGMRDPSSRLLKFRLTLEEYKFKIIYVRGKDNVVADALSRICITSDELKNMQAQLVAVMTRAQKRKIDEDLNKNKDNVEKSDLNTSPDYWSGQPRVVDILRKQCDSVEMSFVETSELNKLKNADMITDVWECFVFVAKRKIIYINLGFKAHFTRAEFVQKLSLFCKKLNVEEVCMIKNKENVEFIKNVCDEISKLENWSGPRICILRGIKRINDDEEKIVIMNDFHLLPSSGHAGVRRMVNTIKKRYYWPSIEKDVQAYVKKCTKCQKSKYSRYIKEPMVITTTASSAFQKIYLDVVGPLDRDIDGNCYILTIQCELSKFVQAIPLKNKETVSIANAFVRHFILIYGIPEIIATDRGTEFISATMEQVCKLLDIKKLSSTAYHHQSIGALENAHKGLGAFLRIQCENHTDTWSYWLPYWCFSFNNTVHSETKYTPYELVFGKLCRVPTQISESVEPLYNSDNYPLQLKYRLQLANADAKKNLLCSKYKRKELYDKSVNSIVYQENDLILLKNETGRKLDAIFEGPFSVKEDLGSNVKIFKNNKIELVHKNRTRPYFQ